MLRPLQKSAFLYAQKRVILFHHRWRISLDTVLLASVPATLLPSVGSWGQRAGEEV